MNRIVHSAIGLALLFPIAVGAQTLTPYPSDDVCKSEREQSYNEGYANGQVSGYTQGYGVGFSAGTSQGIAQCFADPASCGITLASCLPTPDFGETEPNDNLVSADPLILEANFWGQSYGAEDQDWFYTQTKVPNQNIIINFTVPGDDPAGWKISIRDAAGNVFTEFDTGVVSPIDAPEDSITYRATLGFAGTYYVVVEAADISTVFSSYYLSVILQETGLDTPNYVVGFYDAEVEPNDLPSEANPLATTVTMYGLINLTFNVAVPGADGDTAEYVWGQGEDDWFVYYTEGNEIISLSFCARETCAAGNWQFEVYDEATAQQIQAGASRADVVPLLSFNTNNQDGEADPETYVFGLSAPGYYYARVNHKRLFSAPCNAYQYASSTSETGFGESCGPCDSAYNCYIPTYDCSTDDGLSCQNEVVDSCIPTIEAGCIEQCTTVGEGEDATEECIYYKTAALCTCSVFGGVVEIPADAYTSPYNFTWTGTKLPPSTIDTEAYQDFLDRSTPYD